MYLKTQNFTLYSKQMFKCPSQFLITRFQRIAGTNRHTWLLHERPAEIPHYCLESSRILQRHYLLREEPIYRYIKQNASYPQGYLKPVKTWNSHTIYAREHSAFIYMVLTLLLFYSNRNNAWRDPSWERVPQE